MAILFTSTVELKNFVGVSMALELDTLKPHLKDAPAETEVIKILGTELYSLLLSAYDAEDLSPEQLLLLPKVQGVLAPLSVYNYLQEAAVRISDGGVSADRENSAFQWQQEKVEAHYLRMAYFRIDSLIKFMHQNKASFDGWEESSEYKATKEFFINSHQEFQKWVNIGESYRTLVAMRPSMRQAEEENLLPLLTEGLFGELKTAILEENITPAHQALLRFVVPATAFFTMSKALEDLNMEFTAEGAYISSLKANSSANIKERQKPQENELLRKAERFANRGKTWLDSLQQFLNVSASSSLYSSYYQSSNYNNSATGVTYQQDPNSKTFNAL